MISKGPSCLIGKHWGHAGDVSGLVCRGHSMPEFDPPPIAHWDKVSFTIPVKIVRCGKAHHHLLMFHGRMDDPDAGRVCADAIESHSDEAVLISTWPQRQISIQRSNIRQISLQDVLRVWSSSYSYQLKTECCRRCRRLVTATPFTHRHDRPDIGRYHCTLSTVDLDGCPAVIHSVWDCSDTRLGRCIDCCGSGKLVKRSLD
jgi:hypothetical protein